MPKHESDETNFGRRPALKAIGGGVIGSLTLSGVALAGDSPGGSNRRNDSYTWAENDIFEMQDVEYETDPDDEGDDTAHRSLWLIAATGSGTPGEGPNHSPHPNPPGLPIDHVVPFPKGFDPDGQGFTAQWHVHEVVDPQTEAFVNKDQNGKLLTSASRIRNANNVQINPTPIVFTCPIRPHNHTD